ncbi:MAG: asparaginase [Bacillota bacterium]
MAEILVEATRCGVVERHHRGDAAVVDVRGRVCHYAGDPFRYTYMRSAAKPLQALATVETGAMEAFGIDEEELAVTCASHNAEPAHVAAVRSILAKVGLTEQSLRCGTHPPIDEDSRAALYREGGKPSAVHSNCSGKHAGMLASCVHMGWPENDYRDPEHPLQRLLLRTVAEMAGVAVEDVGLGIDGCGVVVHAMPIAAMALAFARLATREGLSAERARAAGIVTGAMHAHPFMVAGTGRVCTALNGLPGGRFTSKGGALGVYCAAAVELGVGVAVKIEDGNGQAAQVAALEALSQLGAFTEEDLRAVRDYHRPDNRNVHGQTVGEVRGVFQLRRTQL